MAVLTLSVETMNSTDDNGSAEDIVTETRVQPRLSANERSNCDGVTPWTPMAAIISLV